jgi:acyl-CoA synthetase (AMP-forming)/AMP-acid ligase II
MPARPRFPAPLSVDGVDVPRTELTRLVTSTARALVDLPKGSGVEITGRHPLAVLATVAAADSVGVPVVFAGHALAVDHPLPVRARVHADRAGRPVVVPLASGTLDRLPPATAAVFWTSGSTGDPHAVLVGRDALVHQAEVTRTWLELDDRDTMLTSLPVNHAYGHSLIQMWLRHGIGLCLNTTFRPEEIVGRLQQGRVTSFDGVPGIYQTLLGLARLDPVARATLAALRLRGCGGDLLPARLAEAFLAVVGAPIHDGYGLTEAGPNVAIARPGSTRLGAVAPPLPGTELTIMPESGEILVRSPSTMLGYFDDPEATAAALSADGWLRTGDIGRIDADGYLIVLGRAKDILVVQGETHPPTVVEAALRLCPGVLDAGVVATPTGRVLGDRVTAFLVGDGARRPTTEALRRHCRAHLPPLLRPSAFEWLDRLPLLSTGKVNRRALRDRLRSNELHGTAP